MSKASTTALSSLKRRAYELDTFQSAASEWNPLQQHTNDVIFAREGDSGVWLVHVKKGVSTKWLDVIKNGVVEIKIVLEKDASLVWLVARAEGASATCRAVKIEMHEGSKLVLAEAFELGVDDCHGESVHVNMVGELCHAELIGRWAQNSASQLCQETLGVISKTGARSFFDQSSKSLKKGDVKLTLLEPNLKVEVDEARANHGAAHGQVDELSMHALMSRGLSRDVSSRLVVASFLGQAWKRGQATPEDMKILGYNEEASWI